MDSSQDSYVDFSIISQIVPSMITDLDNKELISVPICFEVKLTIFHLDPSSALGLYGFLGSFFHATWDIIELDFFSVVQLFFTSRFLYLDLNSNFVVFISKEQESVTLKKFRPIA